MNNWYKVNLLIYPVLQIACFVLALYFAKTHFLFAGTFIILAAFFMSFSLHISYHHHVHHQPNSSGMNHVLDYIISMCLGLPFHFYKLQHLNHHQHNNEIEDMTSTYIKVGQEVKARPFFPYVFLWFLNIKNIKVDKEKAISAGYFNASDDQKMKVESFLNGLVILTLLYFDWRYAFLFGAMFYVGWSLIALHNYGQHLPTKKHQIAYSYYGKWYNLLFMNNGLHYEHHRFPGLRYWNLKKDSQPERTNKWSHLIDGLRYIFQSKS